jgi:LytR cell envelope-related transcriptional attenuator
VAAIVIVAVTSLGGSSKAPATATTAASKTVARKQKTVHHTTHVSAPANAGSISVAVLNGTQTTGLAHRVAGELKHAGYSQAIAQSGTPPTSGGASAVEFAEGHQGEAESIARSLSIAHVVPLEGAVGSLAGTASVVVVVGADRATP